MTGTEQSERKEQIVQFAIQAQRGSQEAFNELYRLTRDRAYFVAFTIAKNEQDALDILQDAYLRAWQKIKQLKDPALFEPWFRQITGNVAKRFVTQREPLLFAGTAEEDALDLLDLQAEKDTEYIPDASMDTTETRRLIMEIIDNLPEDQRLLVLMYYYDDVKLAEIAQSLGIAQATAKNRLFRARKSICDGVENLEKKQGVKLYSAAPIPLMVWLLKHLGFESSKTLPYVILGGTAAAGGGVILGLTMPKLIAAITAAGVVIGGTAAGVRIARQRREPLAAAETTASAAVQTEPDSSHALLPNNMPTLPAPESSAVTATYMQLSPHTAHSSPPPAGTAGWSAPASTARANATTAAARQAGATTANTAASAAAVGTTKAAASTAKYNYTQPATTAATKAATTTRQTTTTKAATTTTTTTAAAPQRRTLGPVNGVTVTGIFPSGASLEVIEDVTSDTEIYDYAVSKLLAIKMYDINIIVGGQPYHQPLAANATVRLPIPGNPAELCVKHIMSDNAYATVAHQVAGNQIVFETNFF